MKSRTRTILTLLLALLPWLGASTAQAADVSVEAVLSQPTTIVGEAVDFQIVITGARSGSPSREIRVDGLQIDYNGESTNVQMNNFNVTMSRTHTFSVLPQRAGTFVIPGQKVDVDGKTYATQPLTLVVNAGSAGNAGGAGAGNEEQGKLAFIELLIPKSRIYVGEVVPIELRLYVDSRIQWQLQQLPNISGDGFTTQKLSQPIRNLISKDGRSYDQITFKTAITPIKTGHLGLGPVDVECIAQIPQKRKRPRFGPDFDSLFNDPMFAPAQKMVLHLDRSELEVVSLPPNSPKSFAGAVGVFSLTSKASPTKVNVGDPITLTLSVSGRGNFDRVNAPKLMEENGWRSYPPSAKFTPDDDIGISGSKTFEMAVVPEQVQPKLPLVEFSYFDPLTEKYVTLPAEREPLTIAAVQAPANLPAPSSQTTTTPSATASPAPSPAPMDIRYILTGPTQWQRSFEPLFARKLFWQLQLLPLLTLLAFAGFRISKARKADLNAQRIAQLRSQKNRLKQSLQNPSIDSKTFYESAVQLLQLETAALRPAGIAPSSIGAAETCSSRPLDPALRDRIHAIFHACDEFRYAGNGPNGSKVTPKQQAEVLQTIQEFEAHAS